MGGTARAQLRDLETSFPTNDRHHRRYQGLEPCRAVGSVSLRLQCSSTPHHYSHPPLDDPVAYSISILDTMGACQSCLGRRNSDVSNNDEGTGLLYDDNGMQYGSFGEQALSGENETVETQRENEAIQTVVAKTSNNMVDVFEIAQAVGTNRGMAAGIAQTGPGPREARFQHLLSKLNTHESPNEGRIGVLADEEDLSSQPGKPASVNTQEGEDDALVGTFADAAAAAAAGPSSKTTTSA